MNRAVASAEDRAADAQDAQRIARALIGEDPLPAETARWIAAVERTALPLARPIDHRLWALARCGAPWLGLVDAGLALTDPWSPVRHRLYLMLAVLEASPGHVDRFEARDTSPAAALLTVAACGAVGAARAVAGIVLVAMLRATTR